MQGVQVSSLYGKAGGQPVQNISQYEFGLDPAGSAFACGGVGGGDQSTPSPLVAPPHPSAPLLKQIGLDRAKFILTTTASLEYDENQYIFFSPSSNNDPPALKVIFTPRTERLRCMDANAIGNFRLRQRWKCTLNRTLPKRLLAVP